MIQRPKTSRSGREQEPPAEDEAPMLLEYPPSLIKHRKPTVGSRVIRLPTGFVALTTRHHIPGYRRTVGTGRR